MILLWKMFILKEQEILANTKLTKITVTTFVGKISTTNAVCLTVGSGPWACTKHITRINKSQW